MLLTMAFPVPVRAGIAGDMEEETDVAAYSDEDGSSTDETGIVIVSQTGNKAVNNKIGYTSGSFAKANVLCIKNNDDTAKVGSNAAVFEITKEELTSEKAEELGFDGFTKEKNMS